MYAGIKTHGKQKLGSSSGRQVFYQCTKGTAEIPCYSNPCASVSDKQTKARNPLLPSFHAGSFRMKIFGARKCF